MSTIAKVFTVLNLVFSLFLVGSVASILQHSDDWMHKDQELQKKYDVDTKKLADEIDGLKGRNDGLAGDVRDAKNKQTESESLAQAKSAEAEQTRNDNSQLRGSVDGMNESMKKLQSDLADTQARNKELQAKADEEHAKAAQAEKEKLDAQDDRTRMDGDLKRANEDIAAKEAQLAKVTGERDNLMAERAALSNAGVDIAGLIGNNVPGIEGKVSAVGAGFVVLSVGQNEGVKIGYPFEVYRGGDYIGRVVVDNVLPDTCTARVMIKNKKGLDFQAMDNATTRL